MKKNPHAVALGKRTSAKKKNAVRINGKLGGRPTKEQQFIRGIDAAIAFHRSSSNDPYDIGNAAICILSEIRAAFAAAYLK